ncbi:MAG: hypothetical protein LDL27_09690 [Desulfovibrio sp.]|nr:hypothetical protein [Desulfovibrio sp.]
MCHRAGNGAIACRDVSGLQQRVHCPGGVRGRVVASVSPGIKCPAPDYTVFTHPAKLRLPAGHFRPERHGA